MAKHSNVRDEGAVFEIVPNTRKVAVPTAHFVIGTVGEHLSEQITFECPKTIDGHDITACDKHYVTWQNVDGAVGHDELVDMTVEGNVARFKWNIRNGLTTAKGVVSFSVHFEDTVNGKAVYKFSTTTCKSCEILDAVNAILGAYEAVYVAGDTLVFADYNAVTDGTLRLETDGLIPEGTLEITANGSYDVGKYAEAKVTIEGAEVSVLVGEDGVVTARTSGDTTTHQLSELDDLDFTENNIKFGVNIFGVEGKCPSVEYVAGKIENSANLSITVHYFGVALSVSDNTDLWGDPRNLSEIIYNNANNKPFVVAKNSLVAINLGGSGRLYASASDADVIFQSVQEDNSWWIVRPLKNGFDITVTSNS